MTLVIAIFWLCGIGVISSYGLYPLLLMLIPARRIAPRAGDELPKLTIIISARNEERRIRRKLEDTLAVDYPESLLEIIVASDASDDGTDNIVLSFASKGVRLARNAQRGGKEAAQAFAISQSSGDILIFTDSATRLSAGCLKLVASRFADPHIGAVSSEDQMEGSTASTGEGAYVRYEMWLRRLESERAGLVGLSGSLFAVKRIVSEEWPSHVPSDISTALRTARLGLRAISEPAFIGYYSDIKDGSKEYERKVRTVVRGMAAVANMNSMLNPARYGLFAFQLWGHKILRWLTPVFMVGVLLSSLVLAQSGLMYATALGAQALIYVSAALAWKLPRLRNISLMRLSLYLVQVHLAMLVGALRFARGERITMWQPSIR